MSNELLQRLEHKVDNAAETIELLRMQIAELEEQNSLLSKENTSLLDKQKAWEQNLNVMLDKLEGVEAAEQTTNAAKQNQPAQQVQEHDYSAV